MGLEGRAIHVENFGAYASARELFEHFGITREAVAEVARALV
nr:transketolase [Streptomyces sp. SID4923]